MRYYTGCIGNGGYEILYRLYRECGGMRYYTGCIGNVGYEILYRLYRECGGMRHYTGCIDSMWGWQLECVGGYSYYITQCVGVAIQSCMCVRRYVCGRCPLCRYTYYTYPACGYSPIVTFTASIISL